MILPPPSSTLFPYTTLFRSFLFIANLFCYFFCQRYRFVFVKFSRLFACFCDSLRNLGRIKIDPLSVAFLNLRQLYRSFSISLSIHERLRRSTEHSFRYSSISFSFLSISYSFSIIKDDSSPSSRFIRSRSFSNSRFITQVP